ncbi:helix-turn-helix transcriptional regulator [Pseudomonas putida]|uniref:helix-turn-helix transcriptional regulator n=1 Tax=Pseudomonas putida TaxID=303 RepID=UPI000819335C|nr:helix-turn-helix transcriptional regulator [Pseudomonas putida]OCT22160.1 LuxR family transcriptional regulator [Pseudomonas putida]OCT25526.1 LuxR family transcriptional regulator [Pseudomonas putida]OCT26906.1 LuxR family transcriptional regulator [Pseudomonas putida]OCT40432.1 LuxR family transcriptional regulator [Pseudomonas putida]
MNSHLLFPQIGKVIASTGSRQFPRLLHDLIQTHLSIDATHIRQVRLASPGSHDSTTLLSETVFSASEPASDDFLDPARLHLERRTADYHYELHVLRADCASFSPRERDCLQDISPLLLPMLQKHLDALQPSLSERPTVDTLQARFRERLSQTGLALSEREMQVCLGLLAGHTAPQQAERLQLKVNTVESYLRRAAIKLGISGRHSLMRWMYGAHSSVPL